MNPVDLAWLAGLLEGEGSFLKPLPSAPKLAVVRVAMTDRDVISRAADIKARFAAGERAVDLAAEFGVSKWLVYRIKEGKRAS